MSERVRFSLAADRSLDVSPARTALFGWLIARRDGGALVLRVDDFGGSLSDRRSAALAQEDLRWLGLDWDEGPGAGGQHQPYNQSARVSRYERTLLELRGRGALYSSGDPATWWFTAPGGVTVEWTDRITGRVSLSSGDIGDFIVAGADGTPSPELAHVTDDAAMCISLVLRDDEQVVETARELLLYDALGMAPPRFGHLPTVRGAGGASLSGGVGGGCIASLRDEGFLPDAVVDHLARLGWSDPLGRAALSREELISAFELTRVSHTPPVHDVASLRALNARHLQALPIEELAAALQTFLPTLPPWVDTLAFASAVRDHIETALDALPFAEDLIAPSGRDPEGIVAREDPVAAERALEVAAAALSQARPFSPEVAYRALAAALEATDPEGALSTVRTALTGRACGLPLPALFGLLGRDRSLERIEVARRQAGIDTADAGNG